MTSPFQEFEKKIHTIYELDIGDFKRRSLSYLNRLEEQLHSSSLKPLFKEMKELIICNKTIEVDVLRNQILQKIKNVNKS